MEVIRNFPDSEILNNLRSRDKMDTAIRAIYNQFSGPLHWYILNNNGNQEDAEDIFQEVVINFIDLVQKDKFRGESTLKTFLYSLNRFTWLNELKKRGRSLVREERFEKEQDRLNEDGAEGMEEREGKMQVLNTLESLGDTCRKILLLFYYENMSMKEILDTTDYESEQVVRNKKYKCLKQLEQMLNKNPALKKSLKNLLHG